MKILKIHVDNFGRLSRLDLSLSEGLNAWQEENGFGKTTLATFIAVMLYGFMDEKGRKLSGDCLREQYRPWQGGKYGGNLVFQSEEGSFTIIREFADSPVRDRLEVLDQDGRKTERFGKNPGQALFAIDGESFLRTIFIRDNELASSVPGDVSARLGNLLDDAMDMNRYENAQKKLKALSDSLNPQRSTGSVHKDKARATELGQKLRGKSAAEDNAVRIQERMRELDRETEALREEKREIDGRIAKHVAYNAALADRKVYEGILAEEIQRNNEYIRAKSHFPNGIPADRELLDAQSANRNADKQEQTIRDAALSGEEKDTLAKAERIFLSSTVLPGETQEMYDCLGRRQDASKKKASLENEVLMIRANAAERKQKEAEEARERELLSSKESAEEAGVEERRRQCRVRGLIFLVFGIAFLLFSVFAASGFRFPFIDPEFTIDYGKTLPRFLLIAGAVVTLAGLITLLPLLWRKHKESEPEGEEEAPDGAEIEQAEAIRLQMLAAEIKEAEEEAAASEQKIRDYLDRFGVPYNENRAAETLSALEALKGEQDRIREKQNRGAAAQEKYDAAANAVRRFIASLGLRPSEDLHAQLEEIEDWLDAYRNAERERANAIKAKEEFAASHDMERITKLPAPEGEETLTELQERSREIQAAIQEKQESAMAYAREMDQAERVLDELREEEETLSDLQEKIRDDTRRYDLLLKAQEGLRTAKLSLSRKYASPVTEHFRKYLGKIINEGEEDFRVDPEGAVVVEDHNEPRSLGSFSHGTRDLTYFCMRLALVDSMYEGEKPPLLLDDPFVNLDDTHVARALDIVKDVSADHQVLYFTCSEGRNASL